MALTKKYDPQESELKLQALWDENSVYNFDPDSSAPIFSIDTPPATVSGNLHLGHTFSYSHPDFIARFHRMNGYNVFYPMGFDDNGLPTGRYVETRTGKQAEEIGRDAFVNLCLEMSKEVEGEYQQLWKRMGLSIDWSHTYRTIDDNSRKIAQLSFHDLFSRGLAYRKDSPTIWCPECRTAIAQAELEDHQTQAEFLTLEFNLIPKPNGNGKEKTFNIATTRPELLASCVAVFVHPDDQRNKHLIGYQAEIPIFGIKVPILEDSLVDTEKGTGVVMCCTFGDQVDVTWWKKHNLPIIESVNSEGIMTQEAGEYRGLSISPARKAITQRLVDTGICVSSETISHSIRVHERCGMPVEYTVSPQWFINILEFKDVLMEAGNKVNWFPAHMKSRYLSWVDNLNWDWCISRQRFFGVPFPLWYCKECGEIKLADPDLLPVDPELQAPMDPCLKCGSRAFEPEKDVMDTWATSSLTPQIVGQWQKNPQFYARVFPFSLRPQAH
jgi:valyl-tRNA synthetase